MILVKDVFVVKHGDDDDIQEYGQIIEIGKRYEIDIFSYGDEKDDAMIENKYKGDNNFVGKIVKMEDGIITLDTTEIPIYINDIEFINEEGNEDGEENYL